MLSATLPVFLLVCCGPGAGLGGIQIASQNMIFESGNRQDLPMRIAVSDTASYLIMAAGPLLRGFVAHGHGFAGMFMLVIRVKLAALTLVDFLVSEPRKRPVRAAC